ncbi:NADPH-dependent oxidoreductase [Phyllobacterium sp. YR531]|uniref:NADPH-dependent oxidoreductase n=1 Tax=Phyllobacterium sp. YR531 TaxID=1144343 RepID=UPI00026F8730|nr:NADPH-dependent oxidoreductase [Phyllobacterium sp. YR531]EJN02123.1 nitroreductase [Phyllobacterium sp. YR531]
MSTANKSKVSSGGGPADDRIGQLLRARYGADVDLPDGHNAGDMLETLLSHRSIRFYLPQPVPSAAIDLAIAAAQSASTSSNLQAWSVVTVEDSARKARINAIAGNQKQIDQAPLLLVWLADLSRARRITAERSETSDGLDYLESFLLAVIDATLAAQNAVIAFESIGLGTCYIGALRNDPATVAKELNLPDEVFSVFGLTVGYPDLSIKTDIKPRLPQSIVVHNEQYKRDAESEGLSDYNAALRIFQKIQLMSSIDWTEQVSRRIGTKEALKKRHELLTVIRKLGFELK